MISNARGAHIIRAKITNLFQRKKHTPTIFYRPPPTANITMRTIDQILSHMSHHDITT